MYDPTTWDWHNPATYFFAVYLVARVGSHIAPSHTVVGRFFRWVLGSVPVPPQPPIKK